MFGRHHEQPSCRGSGIENAAVHEHGSRAGSAVRKRFATNAALASGLWAPGLQSHLRIMTIAAGILLIAHGIAHVVGFVTTWRLGDPEKFPHTTTLLFGRVDLGDAIRWVGLLWLACAIAFVVAGGAFIFRVPWRLTFTAVVACVSLILCVVSLPVSKIGVAIDLVVLGGLFLLAR